MVKNLSCVSCTAWNVFPINSLMPDRVKESKNFHLESVSTHCVWLCSSGVMFWNTEARLGAKKKFSRINDWKIGLSAVQDYSDQQIFNLVLIDGQTLLDDIFRSVFLLPEIVWIRIWFSILPWFHVIYNSSIWSKYTANPSL